MKLLIIGATGGTGQQLIKQALEAGHSATALVRHPSRLKAAHERLTVMQGNVLDYDSVEKAVTGQDAVFSALGHKRWFIQTRILSDGTRNVIRAMEKLGIRRFVCETSLGIGDTKGKMGLYYTLFVIPFLTYFYFKDKEEQERLIRESSLDWVIVRPGQLTNGRKRGIYRHGFDIGNPITTVHISRADVADFMLKQLTDNTYLRKTPSLAY